MQRKLADTTKAMTAAKRQLLELAVLLQAREVERAVAVYENTAAQAPETLLDYQFAELPKDYRTQRRRIIAKGMQQHSGEEA